MISPDIGWASFYNDASTDFSLEFQTEMANQLMGRFNAMVGIENFATDKEFMLFIGFHELKTIYQDGYAFAVVEIISPNSFTKSLTTYWKSSDNENIMNSESVNSENIEFGWCADFETEYFKSFAKKNIVSHINGQKLNFKFIPDLQLFPDLNIHYEFTIEPEKDQIDLIINLLKECFAEAYISDVSKYENKYSTMLDFQGTEVDKGVKQIELFVQKLNSSDLTGVIESITIK
jgi:hypothetical protein